LSLRKSCFRGFRIAKSANDDDRCVNFHGASAGWASQSFSGTPLATIAEIIGLDRLAHSNVYCDGAVVNKFLSLAHERIRSGSALHIAPARRPGARRARFRLFGGETAVLWPALTDEREGSRLSDLIWAGWEMSRGYDHMCAAMRARQEQRQSGWTVSEARKAIVDPAKEITSDPLPTPFGEENVEGSEAIRKTVAIDQ
jgi:hypothetical protein